VVGQEERLTAKGICVIATRHRYLCWLLSLLFVLTLDAVAYAQDTSTCTASILNRTTRVNPDGTFIIDNIPSNQGLGRIRIICPDTNSTRGGASDFTRIVPGGDVNVGNVPLGVIPPSVKSLAVTVSPTTLTGPGATAQLSVEATLSNGAKKNITNGADSTTYTSSNPRIGAVNANGLITAGTQSGTLIVSMVNDGVFASKLITVSLSNDSDNDGLPNDYEAANSCLKPTVADRDADPDNDNATNLAEFNAGTNPCAADTDSDGLNDGQEITIGSNPTLANSDGDGLLDGAETNPSGDDDGDGKINILDSDRDNDGLPDGIEVAICKTPTCAVPTADSDGDGLSNLDEVGLKTDPSRADTDFDGLNDGGEVLNKTDPFKPDTDSDGFSDGVEVEGKSNPLDSASRPFDPNKLLPGDVASPTFSIVNSVAPPPPPTATQGEAVGLTFSIVNSAAPPPPPTAAQSETAGLTFSIVNSTSPSQPPATSEVVGKTISVQNQL
jgi:hypothetical protein